MAWIFGLGTTTTNHVSQWNFSAWAPSPCMSLKGIFFLGTTNHDPRGDFILGHHKACPPREFRFLGTTNHVPQGDFSLGEHHHAYSRRELSSWAPHIMSPNGIFWLGHHHHACPKGDFLLGNHMACTPRELGWV